MSKQQDPGGPSPSGNGFVLERRQFLILGSVALVGFAARPAAAGALVPSDDASLPAMLDVAYVDGMAGGGVITNIASGPTPISARALTTGDPGFLSRTAKVTTLGLWRTESRRAEPLTVALKAYYPTSLSAGGDVPYFGWSQTNHTYRLAPRATHFLIPIDDAGLRLEIESGIPRTPSVLIEGLRRRTSAAPNEIVEPRTRAAIAAQANVASLSLGVEANAAKLRPGTYVLALLPKGAGPLDWSRIHYAPWQMKSDNGPVSAMGTFGEEAVRFDYVVVNVDFAV